MNSRWKGLSAQLLYAVLISLAIALAFFIPAYFSASYLIDKTIYGRVFSKEMADRQFTSLQKYVEEEGIGYQNLQRLNAWIKRGEKIYLSIYQDDVIVYESDYREETSDHTDKFDANLENPENRHDLVLADGCMLDAYLYYYEGETFRFFTIALLILIAFVFFSSVFIFLVRRKVAYILELKEELGILSGGYLDYGISEKGQDEITELAHGINQMRLSILDHQKREDDLRKSSQNLVTAMSHDLKTPLSSLVGYLELLKRNNNEGEYRHDYFLDKAMEKALTIDVMSKKLFEYFLTYSRDYECSFEVVDLSLMIGQLVSEHRMELERRGFDVYADIEVPRFDADVDTDLIYRLFDNLFVNITKHADKASTVAISLQRDGENLVFSIKNGISRENPAKGSTGIGLKSCHRIMEQHGGSFIIERGIKTFVVTVAFKAHEE